MTSIRVPLLLFFSFSILLVYSCLCLCFCVCFFVSLFLSLRQTTLTDSYNPECTHPPLQTPRNPPRRLQPATPQPGHHQPSRPLFDENPCLTHEPPAPAQEPAQETAQEPAQEPAAQGIRIRRDCALANNALPQALPQEEEEEEEAQEEANQEENDSTRRL